MIQNNNSIIIDFVVINAFGVKESIRLHTVLTILNLSVICFVVIAGAVQLDLHNWNIDPADVSKNETLVDIGSGGFLPFGVSGMMAGAATCFYGIKFALFDN